MNLGTLLVEGLLNVVADHHLNFLVGLPPNLVLAQILAHALLKALHHRLGLADISVRLELTQIQAEPLVLEYFDG